MTVAAGEILAKALTVKSRHGNCAITLTELRHKFGRSCETLSGIGNLSSSSRWLRRDVSVSERPGFGI